MPADGTSTVTASALDQATVPDASEPHLVLFNTEAFFALRPELAAQRVQRDHRDDNGRVVASIVGARDGHRLVVGASAPFGGPDYGRDYEPVGVVVDALRAMIGSFVEDGVVEFDVRMKPPHFSANEPATQFALLNMGFAVAASDLNFVIELDGFDSVEDYTRSLKAPARRAIRYAEELHVSTAVLDRGDDVAWFEAYEVLRRNREDKGRPMRLPFEYVRAIRDAFPGLVRMIVARVDGATCAAALVYRIARGHDLVQYWGDANHSLPYSPMNLLVRDVVDHAVSTGASVLDLGISTTDGVPNPGLIQFKRSVGARSEVRLQLVADARTIESR
jgi:hypothetical protein